MRRTKSAMLVGAVSTALACGVLAAPAQAGGQHNAEYNKGLSGATAEVAPDGSYTLSWDARRAGIVTVYASTDPRDPSRSGRPTTVSWWGGAKVTGLDPAKRWYFELVPLGSFGDGTVLSTRQVKFEGMSNARDVGGYKTKDGRTVAWGKVFRTDALNKLTPADQAKLTSMKVGKDFDYRGTTELKADGPDKVPPGTQYVNLPVFDDANDPYAKFLQVMASGDVKQFEDYLGGGRAVEAMKAGNRIMVSGDQARKALGETLRAVVASGDTAVLYHCSAGKDRTGWMTAVLLEILGVPRDTVMQDYLLSNVYRKASNEATIAAMEKIGVKREWMTPLMVQEPQFLNASYDEVKQKYGSFDRYLKVGLGIDKATQDKLRRMMLQG